MLHSGILRRSPVARGGAAIRRWRAQERLEPAALQEVPSERSRERLPLPALRPSEQGIRVETAEAGGWRVVAPIGELDDATLPEFERALCAALASGGPVVIDLGQLTFIDSSGLWALTLAHTTCRRRGIGLRLRPGPARVQNVFEVTGLADLLPFVAAGSSGAAAA